MTMSTADKEYIAGLFRRYGFHLTFAKRFVDRGFVAHTDKGGELRRRFRSWAEVDAYFKGIDDAFGRREDIPRF